jgi:hypothetical protein
VVTSPLVNAVSSECARPVALDPTLRRGKSAKVEPEAASSAEIA